MEIVTFTVGFALGLYCHRSPSVQGTVKSVDLRFGKVLVENEHETVEVNMSEIAQVRYPK